MGLRELKAERTRANILEQALTLFETGGYDATTMEQIAEAAEVGTSTLYRYFPTKVQVLLAPVAEWNGMLATGLEARPAGEPTATALRAVILDYLAEAEKRAGLIGRLRQMLDQTPVARAGLWDVYTEERTSLAAALGRRTGLGPDDPRVLLTAHAALAIVDISLDTWRDNLAHPRPTETATRYIDLLHAGETLLA